jgi:D-3-phosphoglycerate dehydrogenase
MALGFMKVIAADSFIPQVDIKVTFFDGQSITTTIVSQPLNSLFKELTLHVPAQDGYIISDKELAIMKDGVGIVNCARGGVIDEVALVKALDSGILFAGLDVLKANQNLK